MHILGVSFGPSGSVWSFFFHTKEKAQAARAALQVKLGGEIYDDFGQEAAFRAGEVHGMLVRDPELVSDAEINAMVTQEQNRIAVGSRLQSGAGSSLVLPQPGGIFRQ